MKLPIKLNRDGWPRWVGHLLGRHAKRDPRLLAEPERGDEDGDVSAAISAFKFGDTFKTTRPGRHLRSDRLLLDRADPDSTVILDIGASDGSTSLDLVRCLGASFRRYYVTDHNLDVSYVADGGGVSFFDTSGRCILIAGPRFVSYPEESRLVQRLHADRIGRAKKRLDGAVSVPLIHPSLSDLTTADDRVVIRQYDMFDPWDGEPITVVKVGNVLNRAYFTASQIQAVLDNLLNMLPEGGLLLLVENRPGEQAGLFRRDGGRFVTEAAVGPGVEITDLVLEAGGP